MLKNAYLVAKIGADTAEIEQRFAEILPIGRRPWPSRPTPVFVGRHVRLALLQRPYLKEANELIN